MPHATREPAVRSRVYFSLEPRPEQVPAARAFVGEALGPRHPCAETAVLLTSELVTNSVRYSGCRRLGQAIIVTAMLSGPGVRIEVTDRSGPTVPSVRAENGMCEGGRGLWLVQALATDWGYRRNGSHTTTWFACAPLASRAYMSSMTMTAVVSGSRASKTCGTSPGYSR